MCASYGLGGGGHEGDPLPNDPDLAPLDERVEMRFDFAKGYYGVAKGRASLTGRLARNLNPLFRYDGDELLLDKGWFKLWMGGKFPTGNTFNARSDTLYTKWRGVFAHGRALVPADWFNEKGGDFVVADRGIFMIAAVWNRVTDENGDPLTSYALVTRDAAGAVVERNNRMPLLLPPELWQTWLDPDETGTRELAETAVAASNELSDGVRYLDEPEPTLF